MWLAGGWISDFMQTCSESTQDGAKFNWLNERLNRLSRCHWLLVNYNITCGFDLCPLLEAILYILQSFGGSSLSGVQRLSISHDLSVIIQCRLAAPRRVRYRKFHCTCIIISISLFLQIMDIFPITLYGCSCVISTFAGLYNILSLRWQWNPPCQLFLEDPRTLLSPGSEKCR